MNRHSIYKKISWVMFGLTILAITLSTLTVSITASYIFEKEKKQDAEKTLSTITKSLSTFLWTYDIESANNLSDFFASQENINALIIYEPEKPEPIYTYQNEVSTPTNTIKKEIYFDGKHLGHLEIAFNDDAQRKTTLPLLICGLITATILGIFALVFIQRLLTQFFRNPFQKLEQWSSLVAAGSYQANLHINEPELERLATNFNQMAKHISERENRILHQASHDSLTGLKNRFSLTKEIDEKIRSSKDASQWYVLLLDIDNFKKVNDSLGHESGDQLLVEAANRLQSLNSNHSSISRLGGDEFVLVLNEDHDTSEVLSLANAILNEISRVFHVAGKDIFVSASIGISKYPDDGKSVVDILKSADIAMYQAKHSGRNTFQIYNASLDYKAKRKIFLEQYINEGIKNNKFFLVYQPIIDVDTSTVTGAEALLRWDREEKEAIFPDEFIPVAEQSGQIIELGKQVIESAISQLSAFQSHFGDHFYVAINLSPIQLIDKETIDLIFSSLERRKLSTHSIELEITEGVFLSGYRDTSKYLKVLNEKGIRLSMDDFGTGYSSLSYLKDYPFDTLKIDRSFVSSIPENTTDLALVNAISAMAKGLGINVVAEGVETEQQLHFLKEIGCDFAQGYHIGKPTSAESLIENHAHQRSPTFLQKYTP